MDSNSMEAWRAQRLSAGLFPCLNFLCRLRKRMQETGFPSDDPLFQLTCKAHDAVQHLSVQAHYLSCKSGVGSPPKE